MHLGEFLGARATVRRPGSHGRGSRPPSGATPCYLAEKRSRSEVYSAALREYVARHARDDVTEALDRVVAEVGDADGSFIRVAAERVLRATEW